MSGAITIVIHVDVFVHVVVHVVAHVVAHVVVHVVAHVVVQSCGALRQGGATNCHTHNNSTLMHSNIENNEYSC